MSFCQWGNPSFIFKYNSQSYTCNEQSRNDPDSEWYTGHAFDTELANVLPLQPQSLLADDVKDTNSVETPAVTGPLDFLAELPLSAHTQKMFDSIRSMTPDLHNPLGRWTKEGYMGV